MTIGPSSRDWATIGPAEQATPKTAISLTFATEYIFDLLLPIKDKGPVQARTGPSTTTSTVLFLAEAKYNAARIPEVILEAVSV
jgi:hypothetical protein